LQNQIKQYKEKHEENNLIVGFGFFIGLGIQTAGFIVLTFLRDGTSVIIVLTVTIGAFGLTTSGKVF
jgi:hypothetical protein